MSNSSNKCIKKHLKPKFSIQSIIFTYCRKKDSLTEILMLSTIEKKLYVQLISPFC